MKIWKAELVLARNGYDKWESKFTFTLQPKDYEFVKIFEGWTPVKKDEEFELILNNFTLSTNEDKTRFTVTKGYDYELDKRELQTIETKMRQLIKSMSDDKINMNDLEKKFEKVKNLSCEIENFFDEVKFDWNEDTVDINIDQTNAEELFLSDEIASFCSLLSVAKERIDWLKSPVVAQGKLVKDSNNRYILPNNLQLRKGQIVECLVKTLYHEHNDEEQEYWARCGISCDGEKYYLDDYPYLNIEEVVFRTRG